ncbi:MAG: GNAT family N-acetyltransferase [Thermoplasmata archaeon]
MGRDDLDFAIWLMNQEGWEYTRVELERMLRLDPEGSFIYEDKKPLGIVTSVRYGRTGVIGHLIVSREGRGRKIGQSLMGAVVGYLEGVGAESTLSYATQEGVRVHERFGFKASKEVLCMHVRTDPSMGMVRGRSCELLRSEDLAEVVSNDRELFGDERNRVIEMLYHEHPNHCFKCVRDGKIVSYAFGRRTPVGSDLGPWVCVSENREDAEAPLRSFLEASESGTMFLGVFSGNPTPLAISQTSAKERLWNTYLMIRGPGRYENSVRKVFGVAAFELG